MRKLTVIAKRIMRILQINGVAKKVESDSIGILECILLGLLSARKYAGVKDRKGVYFEPKPSINHTGACFL